MIRLYAVSILPLTHETCYENCYRRSSALRREKADLLRMQEDKARCIAAGLLLEYAYKKFRIEKAKELAGANSFGYAENNEVLKNSPETGATRLPDIRLGQRGKPEFVFPEGEKIKPFFNLSHSGNYVICAMADYEIGADVQRKTAVRESLMRRVFSEEEKERMAACDEKTLKEQMFAQIWAAREAEAKLTGRGIGQLLEAGKNAEGEKKKAGETMQCRIWQGMMEEEYAWAVAADRKSAEKEPAQLSMVPVNEGELFYDGMF